jgi:hypothetical protein
MRKLILVLTFLISSLSANAQLCYYQHVETISSTAEDVTFQIKVFCDSKKELSQAAYLAGIRCLMFEGIPGTRFSKAMISEGETTSIEKHPDYYDGLYSVRYTDFVKDCVMLSKFKKSGDRKSTLFEVTIHASRLRKDLEKNNIKTKLGI